MGSNSFTLLIILHQLIRKLVGILIFNTISHFDLHQFYSITAIHQFMTLKEKEELSKPQNTICTIKCDLYKMRDIISSKKQKKKKMRDIMKRRRQNHGRKCKIYELLFLFYRRKRFFTVTP